MNSRNGCSSSSSSSHYYYYYCYYYTSTSSPAVAVKESMVCRYLEQPRRTLTMATRRVNYVGSLVHGMFLMYSPDGTNVYGSRGGSLRAEGHCIGC